MCQALTEFMHCVCSWVSAHCHVVEAARSVQEEIEAMSEDCNEELTQLEVGSCTHTHTHTHTRTHTHTQTIGTKGVGGGRNS